MSETAYTVQPGDTLSAITSQYAPGDMTYQELAEYNNISDPNSIDVGEIISIPDETDFQAWLNPATSTQAPVQQVTTVDTSGASPSQTAAPSVSATALGPVQQTAPSTASNWLSNLLTPAAAAGIAAVAPGGAKPAGQVTTNSSNLIYIIGGGLLLAGVAFYLIKKKS